MSLFFESDHPFIAISYWFLRKLIGFPIRLIFIHKVTGLTNIPSDGSAILAFNHQSFFDFICFAAVTPRNIHFLAAEKFFDHFLWNFLMTFTGQIRVDRHSNNKDEVYLSINKHIKKGSLIGIFPEGTRSPHKDEMLKAFTGVAHFALRHKISIIPVGIVGTFEIMSKHDKVPRFKKVVDINIGGASHFLEHHGKHHDKSVCTLVTEHVMKNIEILSGKKYPHYESKT